MKLCSSGYPHAMSYSCYGLCLFKSLKKHKAQFFFERNSLVEFTCVYILVQVTLYHLLDRNVILLYQKYRANFMKGFIPTSPITTVHRHLDATNHHLKSFIAYLPPSPTITIYHRSWSILWRGQRCLRLGPKLEGASFFGPIFYFFK